MGSDGRDARSARTALKQRLEVHRNTQLAKLLAAEQRLAWARSTMCTELKDLIVLTPHDGLMLYQQMLTQASPEQFEALRALRKRREAAPFAPPTMMAAERKALRNVPTRDESIANAVVPVREAFKRFLVEYAGPGPEEPPRWEWPTRTQTPFRQNRHNKELGRRLHAAGARPGYITCSLMWERPRGSLSSPEKNKPTDDEIMTLHCSGPGGEVSRLKKTPGVGGGLLNVSDAKGDYPLEHIIFPHRPMKAGAYRFWVSGGASVSKAGYTVRMVCNGHTEMRRIRLRGDQIKPCWEFQVSNATGEVVLETIAIPSDRITDSCR